MRLHLIALTCALLLAGCESEQEKRIQQWEQGIRDIVEADWQTNIPVAQLIEAGWVCRKHTTLKRCDLVEAQLRDVATTYYSCKVDPRSQLCQSLLQQTQKYAASTVFPKVDPVALPGNPVYWRLPTAALEAQASNFKYRAETLGWWWAAWRAAILTFFFCLAGTGAGYGGWRIWTKRRKAREEQARAVAREREAHRQREKARKAREGQERIEAEEQAAQERLAVMEERRRRAEILAAKQKADAAAAKLAADQAEVADLLNSIFSNKNKNKGGHDDSPQ